MKNLKDILEKLKVDDIVLTEKFPIDGTSEDVREFLLDNGFEEVPYAEGWRNIAKALNSANGLVFMQSMDKRWIRFANTKEHIKHYNENPAYTMFFDDDCIHYQLDGIELSNDSKEVFKEKFLKAINKKFDWR